MLTQAFQKPDWDYEVNVFLRADDILEKASMMSGLVLPFALPSLDLSSRAIGFSLPPRIGMRVGPVIVHKKEEGRGGRRFCEI